MALLLDLLFPPRCVACGEPGAEFCAGCASRVHQPPQPRCARCDSPLPAGGPPGARCHPCLDGAYAPALDRITVAAVYEEPLRSAVHALKYKQRRRMAVPLADLARAAWQASGLEVDIIIPMALHSSRERQRGYNQVELLARRLTRAIGAPTRGGLLIRTRATTSQTRLTWDERRSNVAGAFSLAPGAASALAGQRVLLLDDIITSGATVNAAASALRAANPTAVYALAVARPEAHPASQAARLEG